MSSQYAMSTFVSEHAKPELDTTDTALRLAMTDYWKSHSKEASLNDMMLDKNATELNKYELPEILSYLPDYEGKTVVELGAGIGRFTGVLAQKAKHVLAVDFMESFIVKNKELNAKYSNIEYRTADVTAFELPANSVDVVFSNWLLMYLDDAEVQKLMTKQMSWLREGGYLFCRESCRHSSGDRSREANPTRYRDPDVYDALFQSVAIPTEDKSGTYVYEMTLSKPVDTYVLKKKNINQVVWQQQKVKVIGECFHGYSTFQEFLDKHQYSRKGIIHYEKMFGHNFISAGGLSTAEECVKMLNLKQGQRVLDVGCGIGGSAFYMVDKFDVAVKGLDLSVNVIRLAIDRMIELGHSKVEFEIADATKREYKAGSFHVVYSRDSILHIADKKALFNKFYKWLKPGGTLLITDYCSGAGKHSLQFQEYIKDGRYYLLTLKEYGQVIKDAGFKDVIVEDKTQKLIHILGTELENAERQKDEMVEELSAADYDHIITKWKMKIENCIDGCQKWGLFLAKKPTQL